MSHCVSVSAEGQDMEDGWLSGVYERAHSHHSPPCPLWQRAPPPKHLFMFPSPNHPPPHSLAVPNALSLWLFLLFFLCFFSLPPLFFSSPLSTPGHFSFHIMVNLCGGREHRVCGRKDDSVHLRKKICAWVGPLNNVTHKWANN